MKACNVVNLLVVVGCVTLTSNVYAQASNAMPMASSPAASSGKATPRVLTLQGAAGMYWPFSAVNVARGVDAPCNFTRCFSAFDLQ